MVTRNQEHRPTTRDNAFIAILPGVEVITISIVTKYEVFCTTLRPITYVLENFHRKFANFVAPSTNRTMKHLVLCKAYLVL